MDRRQVLTRGAMLCLSAALAGCARPRTEAGGSTPDTNSSGIEPRATAGDYVEFEESSRLSEVYALTWVRDRSPEDVVVALGARPLGRHTWPVDGWVDLPGSTRDEAVLAVTPIAGWAVVVEDMSANTVDEAMVKRLSAGTRLVTTYYNFEADGYFVLADDGVVQVDFDPSYPISRTGGKPDLLLADMRAVGLDLSGRNLDPADPAYRDVPYLAAALALAERITGIRLTAELLHTSTYLAAAVPDPGRGAVVGDEEPQVSSAGP
ncbi:DUF6461 domain-containing protein [Micromonosporaceae bacterium Da 78-11]